MLFLLAFCFLANQASIGVAVPMQNGQTTFISNAEAAVDALQLWYNSTSGIWDTSGWWNGGNALTMLADFVAIDPAMESVAKKVFPNTFNQAQKYNLQQLKVMTPHSLKIYNGDEAVKAGHKKPLIINPIGFVNDYYDDEGWWALAWLKVYDHTHEPQYLKMATDIFADLITGWGATCGGLWWNKAHSENGAIENEIFITVAAQLANRVPSARKQFHLDWALKSWTWFHASGMINAQNLINNGLDLSTCKNDGGTVWSYNQGVILGALVELATAFPANSSTYLSTATAIASAAIVALSDSAGILHDPCEPNCGNDGPQFKGIFMRNLQLLQAAAPQANFKTFIEGNARGIWANARNDANQIGVVWSGPPPGEGVATASTQSSALDALVAAVGTG